MSVLELRDVVVDYDAPRRRPRAGRRRGEPQRRAGADRRARRRVRLRQVDARPGGGRARQADLRLGRASPAARSRRSARRGRQRDLARLQLVFQNPYSSLNPRRKIGSQVADALATLGIVPPAERPGRVRELCELVGLPPGAVDRFPHEFSGGQRQRIAIARDARRRAVGDRARRAARLARRLRAGAARKPPRPPLPRARPRAAADLARPRDRAPRRRRGLGHVPRPDGRDRRRRGSSGISRSTPTARR